MTTLTPEDGSWDVRLNLACELAERASENGHKVLIAEKFFGENIAAVQKLNRHGASVYPQIGQTVGEQRRDLFHKALDFITRNGNQFDGVLWTEEKPYMAKNLDDIIERRLARGAAALIPGRSYGSWLTWPMLQQFSEPVGNLSFNRLFGVSEDGAYDPMHGPCYFGLEAIEDVLCFNPSQYGLEDKYVQQYIPIVLLSRGVKVASLAIDCTYPANQRVEEEGPKFREMLARRVGQLKQITDGHLALHQALFADK